MGMLSFQKIIFTTILQNAYLCQKGGWAKPNYPPPHFRFRRPMEYHIFSYCSTFEILFVLMTYKHNLVTNSIELWIDEITSPSAYSRIKEALKLACFREILLCSVHLCGQLQIGLWKYWTFLLFGHVASFLKEIGVDGQKK